MSFASMLTKVITGLVVVLFLAVAGVLVVSSFSVPGVNFHALAVQSGSMEPAIQTGSLVFVVPSSEYREGDIITFRRQESRLDAPITHRIVAVEVREGEYAYTTKGDANEYEDTEKVWESEVWGSVRFSIPHAGTLVNQAKTPIGFAALVIVPALIIIGDEAKKIVREIRRRKAKAE